MKTFYQTISIENRKFNVFEVEDISTVNAKDDEIYVWLKGGDGMFYFKASHYSEALSEIQGIGDEFKSNGYDLIENKKFWIDTAIQDIKVWMTCAIDFENFEDNPEEHF